MVFRRTECKNSKECHAPKHHFDECVERVQGAGDDNKEDCVEECKYPDGSVVSGVMRPAARGMDEMLTRYHSFPPRPLRDPVRCAQAVVQAQVNTNRDGEAYDGNIFPEAIREPEMERRLCLT